MRIVIALLLGALIADWAHLRIEHQQLKREHEFSTALAARSQRTSNQLIDTLMSCRRMVDDHMTSQGQILVEVLNTDMKKERRRHLRPPFIYAQTISFPEVKDGDAVLQAGQ